MAKKIDKETLSYFLGILSIAFIFVNPIAGLIMGIFGFKIGKNLKLNESIKLSKIGIILNILLMVLYIVVVVYSFTTGFNSTFPTI